MVLPKSGVNHTYQTIIKPKNAKTFMRLDIALMGSVANFCITFQSSFFSSRQIKNQFHRDFVKCSTSYVPMLENMENYFLKEKQDNSIKKRYFLII